MSEYISYKHTRLLSDWINTHADFDTFITLTLKQRLPLSQGGSIPLTDEECVRTAWIFRDRLSKALLGSGRTRAGKGVPTAVFLEGDGRTLRRHLHLVIQRPDANASLMWVKARTNKAAENLQWVYKERDLRPIVYGRPEFVTNYCLKYGTDRFLPEASDLRSSS
jgi:hypothetical protein